MSANLPSAELRVLQCIAAQNDLLDGATLRPYHATDEFTRDALRYARQLRQSGIEFGPAELAKAAGNPELAGLILVASLVGDTAITEKFLAYEKEILGAFTRSPRGQLLARMEAVQFNHETQPPANSVVFSMGGTPVSTAGNINVVSGLPGSAKSAIISGFIAASMPPDGVEPDSLGINGANASGKLLLHFDTEQDPVDAWNLANRALRRAKREDRPYWFRSYSLAPFKRKERLAALVAALEAYGDDGVYAVLIDGAADLIASVNDEEQAIGFVDELHQIAIRFQCAVIVVVHINPGMNAKTRGHLGSELTRKCENEFLLKAVDGVTTVTVTKHRRAPIAPFSFKWDDQKGMHSLCKPVRDSRAISLARNVFDGDAEIRATEAIRRIEELEGVSNGTAKTRWKEIVAQQIAVKNQDGKYNLAA